jgi:hypothetical protein
LNTFFLGPTYLEPMDEDYALGGPCILSKAPSIKVAMESLTNPPTPAAAMTSPSPSMQKSESTSVLCKIAAGAAATGRLVGLIEKGEREERER